MTHPQGSDVREALEELKRALSAIRVVAGYDGKDCILRGSVIDIVDQRIVRLTAPVPPAQEQQAIIAGSAEVSRPGAPLKVHHIELTDAGRRAITVQGPGPVEFVPTQAASHGAPSPVQGEAVGESFDRIDRFLRNNLDDADYADYSASLGAVLSANQCARCENNPANYPVHSESCCANCGKPSSQADAVISDYPEEGEWFCSSECHDQHGELGCPHEHHNGYRHPAEAKRLIECENVLRSLASWLGNGGYNAPTVDAKTFEAKIRDGIEHLYPARPVHPEQKAEAAPPAQPGAGWQPIETAPKDGSWILLAGKTGATDANQLVCRWDGATWQSGDDGYGAYIAPTGWMPLPAAPEGEKP